MRGVIVLILAFLMIGSSIAMLFAIGLPAWFSIFVFWLFSLLALIVAIVGDV